MVGRDGIDRFSNSIAPRPLYSERRAMERMGDARLGVHLLLRTAWFRGVPFGGLRFAVFRHLWRLYRRTW